MKKINEVQALKLINQGYYPQCAISRIRKPIRSKAELDQLQRLVSVQPYTLYGWSESEISQFKNLPEDSISVSLDEALEMVFSGEIISAKVLGEKRVFDFHSPNALLDFFKKNSSSGLSVLFYWEG